MSRKKNSKPGDAFVGIGAALVAFSVIFGAIAIAYDVFGPGFLILLFLGLALIGLGYLRRMTVAVEKKSGQSN